MFDISLVLLGHGLGQMVDMVAPSRPCRSSWGSVCGVAGVNDRIEGVVTRTRWGSGSWVWVDFELLGVRPCSSEVGLETWNGRSRQLGVLEGLRPVFLFSQTLCAGYGGGRWLYRGVVEVSLWRRCSWWLV